MSEELQKAFDILDKLKLTPQEDKYARKLSTDFMGFLMERATGAMESGVRLKAVVAAVAITLQAINDIERKLTQSGSIDG